ncbi:hypothetical protein B0H13DRAFT_1866208 [Mycena leptocephala]|nr:hypothetical protein B0H13DRAFT_1866208 [Mycena leptocephala]
MHCHSLGTSRLVALMVNETKPKLTRDEILDRRAQAPWEYRCRNREIVNEKARLRMQKRREQLQNAPAAVQAEHQAKARQYRRRYLDCNKEVSRRKVKPVPSKQKIAVSPRSPETPRRAAPSTAAIQKSNSVRVTPINPVRFHPASPPTPAPASYRNPRTPESPTPRSRNPHPTPRKLADIAAASESESEEDPTESDEEHAWEGDTEAEGPLLNPTGHPDYVPQPGQQPYFKEGRRYWF